MSAKQSQRPPQPSPFKQVPESPRLESSFRGIAITTLSKTQRPQGLMVHGAVQVPEKDFDPGAKVLDAVALVVTRPPLHGPYKGEGTFGYTWMPFRERVILGDDIRRSGGCVVGYFNVALPKEIPPFPEGSFYLMASVGPYLSEVLTVQIG